MYYTLFFHSTHLMAPFLSHAEMVAGLQETLWRTTAQIYNLWAQPRAMVHTAISRLMHADRDDDHRQFAYYSLQTRQEIDDGTMPGGDHARRMLDWNSNGMYIRHMSRYMGMDSNIRFRLGLVDAEHIVETDNRVMFWGSLFEMVINFVYSGYANGLSKEEIRDIFTPLKMELNGEVKDVFPRDLFSDTPEKADPLGRLIDGMLTHIDQISTPDYKGVQVLIEAYLPSDRFQLPRRIFLDDKRSLDVKILKKVTLTKQLTDAEVFSIAPALAKQPQDPGRQPGNQTVRFALSPKELITPQGVALADLYKVRRIL